MGVGQVVAVLLLSLLGLSGYAASESAGVWTTTYGGSLRLAFTGNLVVHKGFPTPRPSNNGSMLLILDTKPPMQQFDGFGGALSSSTAFLLKQFKHNHPDRYWQLLQQLFNASVEGGVGFSVVRLPISSTDFSVG